MKLDKKVFVDLDRTLFDTDIFVASLWLILQKKYGVDAEAEKKRAPKFYTYDGDLYDYHFFDHLKQLNIGNDEAITLEMTLQLRNQFLLFNDVEEGLKVLDELGEFTILTFGNERYQKFKLSCVPELTRYPVVTVQQHKKHFFSHQYTDPSILIDDKDLGGSLPEQVEFYRIDRMQPLPVMDHKGYKSIRRLQNIKEALQ